MPPVDGAQVSNPRLVSYLAPQGPRAAVVIGEAVVDWSELAGRDSYITQLDVLNDWKTAQLILDAASQRNAKLRGRPMNEVSLLAPILYPSAIYCAGANYADHMEEMARVQQIEPDPDPHGLGIKPWHFIKSSRSVTAPDSAILLPQYSNKVDWEAELAAVIGTVAKNVLVARALEHVAGYTIANDLSARDCMQRPNVPDGSPFKFDWISQKCFDGACPVGPWIVPAKQVPDPQTLNIKLWVNDVLKQDSYTGRMIFTLAEQIAHLSSRITLYPGDVILTGTPAGVGVARGEFLKPGDFVRISIEQIGTLTNTFA